MVKLPSSLQLIAILCLGLKLACRAQLVPSQTDAVDRLMSAYIVDHHVPGLSVAVVSRGSVILAKGYGLADIENGVAATAETVFRIASLSKSITTTGAMKLVEQGKLDLDAPIQNYCPAFPQKPWPITTRELLEHQSGIRHYRNDEETINTKHYGSISSALAQFANDPLEFEPGTRMQYTSYGYIVLGCVMEGASHSDYATLMRDAVFLPAKMDSTRLDDVFAIVPHRAHGYTPSGGTLHNATFVDISNKPPGSGINSSAHDMGNFIAQLYAGKLVSSSTLQQMFTPAKTRGGKATIYGLGFFLGGPLSTHHGLREVGHGGDVQGFSSVLYLLPEKQFGVVILCNSDADENSAGFIDLSRKLYDIAAAKDYNP